MLSRFVNLPIFNRMNKEIGLYTASGPARIMTGTSGMTLMEVMIVVVIIGILAGVAMPGMIGWFSKRSLDSASREMFSNFQRARSEAITRATNVQIQIDSGNEWYRIQDANGNVIVPQTNMPEGIDLESAATTTGFTFRGFSTTPEITVTITSEDAPAADNWRRIRLNPGGTVSIEP